MTDLFFMTFLCLLYLPAPTVCFNAVKPKADKYAYFICPEAGMDDNHDHCCGDYGEEVCCGDEPEGGE